MQEFKRMQVEEAERKKAEAENTSGWSNNDNQTDEVITELDATKLRSEMNQQVCDTTKESP